MTTSSMLLPVAHDSTLSHRPASTLFQDETTDSTVESSSNSPQASSQSSVSEIPFQPIENAVDAKMDSVGVISTRILEIIFDYALNKFDDCRDRLEAGRSKFIAVLNEFVEPGHRIRMALPAFPFKSANKVYKALGFLPDKAEEIALARLHNMCERIREIYEPGATVIIISDGLVYNDLLSISDRHTWLYGQALRAMAKEKAFTNIEFSRLRDFVPVDATLKLPEVLDEISYVANATNFRRFILNKFGKDDLDVDHLIAVDEDTRLTYQGYRRFLMSDLRHIFTLGVDRTSNAYKRETKYLAKQMLVRGFAFAGAIKHNFPHYLRLSIHQSTGEHKVSMSLLNTRTGYTTPWHCSIALMANGEWMSAPMGDFKMNPRMKIVEENGRPSYFREVSEEEFKDDQKRAEELAKAAEATPASTVTTLKEPERNENFVQWEGLGYEVKRHGHTKRLLHGLDGWLRGGTLTALMGPSWAGKTVLLDVLGNKTGEGVMHGDILVNGKPLGTLLVGPSATVYQHDLHFSTATVKEALVFSALLRQPSTTRCVEKLTCADEVLTAIGMEAFADTIIGDSGENLNSEQTRRLAIGIELAAKPTTFLLLDQPLAGLDSQAAYSICQLLRQLAQRGLAILCILNQASVRLLQCFDRLLLLGQGGGQVYFGKVGIGCRTIIDYFQRNGARQREADESPTEWILDFTSTNDDIDDSKDWVGIWTRSPERTATKNKLAQLRHKFSAVAGVTDAQKVVGMAQQPVTRNFDAVALHRTFYKYLYLANTKMPVSAPADEVRFWRTNESGTVA